MNISRSRIRYTYRGDVMNIFKSLTRFPGLYCKLWILVFPLRFMARAFRAFRAFRAWGKNSVRDIHVLYGPC